MLVLGSPGAARAGPPAPEGEVPNRLDREVLLEFGRPAQDRWEWVLGGVRISPTGLKWKRSFEVNDRPIELKLGGPVIKKGYGLKIEIKF
jgi:hypothetical protein